MAADWEESYMGATEARSAGTDDHEPNRARADSSPRMREPQAATTVHKRSSDPERITEI